MRVFWLQIRPQRWFSSSVLIFAVALSLSACGGGGGGGGGGSNPGNNGAGNSSPNPPSFQPAVVNSPYASVLVDCIEVEQVSESCTLDTLPLIGQETNVPAISDVMNRTVVSHAWMANRFEAVLREMPDALLQLMGSLTAVVIGADVRPSYYTTLSGAIYLDPADLWLTNEEKATINQAEDFRAGFGLDLNFLPLWRYVVGNDYAWDFYPLDGSETRELGDIVLPMAALLFHELAHANDFYPSRLHGSLDGSQAVVDLQIAFGEAGSEILDSDQPLNSLMLFGLASVIFEGTNATPAQLDITPTQVGLEFEIDGANDLYAYSVIYEDFAMLFEEIMMKYYFDVDREIAFTDYPRDNPDFCDGYVVRWGSRGRIGHHMLRPRVEFVLQQILGINDVSEYLDAIEEPVALTNGLDWCTNLILFNNTAQSNGIAPIAQSRVSNEFIRPDDFIRKNRAAGRE